MLALTILSFYFFLSFVHATPLMMREVFSPHIISPNSSTTWPVGTNQLVTWETDNIPPDSELTNPNGKVVLGHLGSTGGLNLDLDNPLAQNFKLHIGQVQITVPSVPPRDDYIIVLFGDSGNTSPAFAITQITDGSNTTTTSTTKASTTTIPSASISSSISKLVAASTTASATSTSLTALVVSSTTSTSSPASTQTTPSSSSTSTSTTSAAAAATTTSNAAWASNRLASGTHLASIGVVSLVIGLII